MAYRSPYSRSFNKSASRPTMFTAVALLVGVGLTAAIGTNVYYQTKEPETLRVTVTDKERQVKDEDSKYIVFTDREVFENTDSLLRGKFNSSDVQGALHPGCTYDLKVYGFRNHFFSLYRNILEAQHAPDAPCKLHAAPVPEAPRR